MSALINFFINSLGRFGRWLVTTRDGRITTLVIVVLALMQHDPQFIPNLVIGAITWLIGIAVALLKANQRSIEYLVCIGILIYCIRFMFRGVFKSGGGANKK